MFHGVQSGDNTLVAGDFTIFHRHVEINTEILHKNQVWNAFCLGFFGYQFKVGQLMVLLLPLRFNHIASELHDSNAIAFEWIGFFWETYRIKTRFPATSTFSTLNLFKAILANWNRRRIFTKQKNNVCASSFQAIAKSIRQTQSSVRCFFNKKALTIQCQLNVTAQYQRTDQMHNTAKRTTSIGICGRYWYKL